MNENFETALIAFAHALSKMLHQHHAENKIPGAKPCLTVEHLQKYVRVSKDNGLGTGKSVYCFIDMETGDVLKPAGWKGPARGARGNIYAANPIQGCGPYGVIYLR